MNQQVETSMSLANPIPPFSDNIQKVAVGIGSIGLLILFVAWFGGGLPDPTIWLYRSIGLMTIGVFVYSWRAYMTQGAGIKNNGVWFSGLANRGVLGWVTGIVLTGFYVVLYWYPQYLGLNGEGNTGLVGLFDPLSQLLKGQPASEWFVYGTLYTVAIVIFGFKFILKYRHNKYQIVRTISVMFFQLGFAFLLPEFMLSMNLPYNNFANMWPLNYYFFYDWNINNFLSAGNIGFFMLVWGILMFLLISPALTYFYGKRWYCSWVCGCGGLAETAGDPFRHLSNKSLNAWKVERWLIHGILVFITIMTVAVLYSYFNAQGNLWINKTSFLVIVLIMAALVNSIVLANKKSIAQSHHLLPYLLIGFVSIVAVLVLIAFFTGNWNPFFIDGGSLRSWYGFLVGAAFSGVVGVGFYPLMGSRVWCRFGCPMAALLGIQQKFFSRFRITTNGGQCISCGNCSTYCEMGIDVRSYAQRGQNVVRASCVGCGICAAVCPRGVLRLENGSVDIHQKTDELKTIHISEGDIRILS
ncbi:MAG: 4Fe-4S dicluster domain-containing protein [Bacteroidota bacterium]